MRIAIITGITGGMDDFKGFPLQMVTNGQLDAVFTRLTDKDVPKEFQHLNKRTQALYFKQQMMNYMPGFDLYLWIDGKVQVDTHHFVQQCIDALGDNDLAILEHGTRKCVYEEVRYITEQIENGSDYLAKRYADRGLIEQANLMLSAGYPEDAGLNDCSIFIVRNKESTKRLFGSWWDRCKHEKAFDQIWIRYLAWSQYIKIQPIKFRPNSFHLVKHKKIQ